MTIEPETLKLWLYDWHGANNALFTSINQQQFGSLYDHSMVLATLLADYHYFPFYLLALGLLCGVAAIKRKMQAPQDTPWLKEHVWHWGSMFAVFVIAFLLDGVVISWLKDTLLFPRPLQVFPTGTVRMAGPQLEAYQFSHSFPSGHAAFAAVLVASIWPILTRFFKIVGVVFVLWACWSRISLGFHFPADVMTGTVISVLIVMIVRKIVMQAMRQLFRKETS